jgi:hypothetical protein
LQFNSTGLLLSAIVSPSLQVHSNVPCNCDINFPSSLDKIHVFVLCCRSYVLPSSNKVKFYCDFMRMLKGTLFIFLQETYFTSPFLFIYLCNILLVLVSRMILGKFFHLIHLHLRTAECGFFQAELLKFLVAHGTILYVNIL